VRVGGVALDRGELLGAVRAQPLAVLVLAEVHDVRGPLGGGRGAERAEEEEERGGEPSHCVWSQSRRRSSQEVARTGTNVRGWVYIYSQACGGGCGTVPVLKTQKNCTGKPEPI
jgi:hypothetical protein